MSGERGSSARRAIALAALVIGLGNVASRLLGVVREAVISGTLGYAEAASAFTTASRVPTMVYDLLIGGAISAALIPVFSEWAERRDRAEAWRLVSAVLNAVVVLIGGATLLIVALADPLAWLLAGGLPPDAVAETSTLIRLVAPSLVFFAGAAVVTSALYARQVFAYGASAAALYNLGVIAGALALGQALGLGASGVVLGIVLGALLQVAVQWPGLLRAGFAWQPALWHPELPRVVRYYLPVAAGLAATQLSIMIDTKLANDTGATSAAVMRYATTLVQLPLGLVATGISFAVLPALARLAPDLAPDAQVGDSVRAEALARYRATLAYGIRLATLLILPMTVGLIVLREPMVRLIFERGRFDAGGTELTALAFLLYAPQLPFVPVDLLLINAFYARKDTLTPMVVGLVGVGVYLGVALALVGPLGMPGLVLANSAQNVLHTLIMWALVRRAIGPLVAGATDAGGAGGIWSTTGKAVAASVAMGSVVALLAYWLDPLGRSGFVGLVLELAVAVGVGVAVYLLAAMLLRTAELWELIDRARARLGGGRR